MQGVEYQWTGPTFAAKLAAGTLPTVFTVPFTDGRTLGDNGQLADLTSEVKALPYYSKYNPAVIAEGTDSSGKIIAIPTAAYAQALHYNRTCSPRPASTPTSRRPPGPRSRPTPRRSPPRPGWPGTRRWARTTTPRAGS